VSWNYCTFQQDLCGWQNDPSTAGHRNWTRYAGTTPTQGTGPTISRNNSTNGTDIEVVMVVVVVVVVVMMMMRRRRRRRRRGRRKI
jgi:hypothetical protein